MCNTFRLVKYSVQTLKCQKKCWLRIETPSHVIRCDVFIVNVIKCDYLNLMWGNIKRVVAFLDYKHVV